MGLRELRSELLRADFKPHALTPGLSIGQLIAHASPEAREVLALCWKNGRQPTIAEQLTSEQLPVAAVHAYRALSVEDRLQFLALVGFGIHELVHKIDFLCTPFGVSFQGRSCLEVLGYQESSGEVLSWLNSGDANRPLRDMRPPSDQERVREGVDALLARIRWFDGFRGASRNRVVAGWAGGHNPVPIAGQLFEPVLVDHVLATVMIPGSSDSYLRPLTILESRAVAISLMYLHRRLGGGDEVCRDLAAYMRTFYEPSEDFPDYRFLLDLFAVAAGVEDFATLLESRGSDGLDQVVDHIVVLGWYALHAPPLMPSDAGGSFNSSAVGRLFAAFEYVRAFQSSGPVEPGAFLAGLDQSEAAREFGLAPCAEVVPYCLQYLTLLRKKNAAENTHPGLRAHFEYVFSTQISQLERRVGKGYDSSLGMPGDGDLVRGFDDFTIGEHLMVETYRSSLEVEQWFALRESLAFGYARPPGFATEVAAFIGGARAEPVGVDRRFPSPERAAAEDRARVAETTGDPDRERILSKAFALGSPTAAYNLGTIYLARGNLKEAEECFRAADYAGIPEAAYNLGVIGRDSGRLKDAVAAFARADERGDADGAYDYGLIVKELDSSRALTAFCRADARGHADAPNAVGIYLLAAGDRPTALRAFARADARGSESGARNLATLLAQRGDLQAAESASRRARARAAARREPPAVDLDATSMDAVMREVSDSLEACVAALSLRYRQFSKDALILPFCAAVLAGRNVLLVASSEDFEAATALAWDATHLLDSAQTAMVTPTLMSSLGSAAIPPEATFVVLRDVSRFSDQQIALITPAFGDGSGQSRHKWLQGRRVHLGALHSIIGILDTAHADSPAQWQGAFAVALPVC